MSLNFSAFEVGKRALNASQYAINVTGQNIANVNTPGYVRRQVLLAEATTATLSGQHIGTGVKIAGVQSFRDNLILSRIQNETGIAGRLSAFRESFAPVEVALQGGESGGLENAMTSFFGAWRDLDANPNSLSIRSVVVQRAQNLTSQFQSTRSKLDDVRTDTDGQIRTVVEEVNTITGQIAALNQQIIGNDAARVDSSALQDQRGLLTNRLAELTGARQTTNADGTINMSLGDGRSLVSGVVGFQLVAASTPPLGFAQLQLNGEPAIINEGKLRGYLDSIAANSAQIDKLDGMASALATRVNSLHTTGTDLNGSPGGEFFDRSVPVTAANIRINAAVLASPGLVVASPIVPAGENGTVAGAIANLMTDRTTTVGSETGSFSSLYGTMLSDAGERLNSAAANLETQAAVIAQATLQRDAVSGVSLDEEAVNLLQYQKAFEAAARFIRVADEMTQTIISLAQ